MIFRQTVRVASVIFMCAMPCALIASVYLHRHLADMCPRQPDPYVGRIYPLNVHGTTVYMTKVEDAAIAWIFNGGLLSGIVGGALWRSANRR